MRYNFGPVTTVISNSGWTPLGFPVASPALEEFGLKFTAGGAHISRTMMLTELESVLVTVPSGSSASDYRDAILARNALAKTTESTRQKSFRHLRELYALDESVPIFALLRKLNTFDPKSLPLLAGQVAWARDPLFRATTAPILDATEGARVDPAGLAQAVEAVFPNHYSGLSCNKIARNAASSWTQSGHLAGRANKTRSRVKPTPVAITLAMFLGQAAGFHGPAVFSNPWCRLLDLTADQARTRARDAHRAGLLNLRAVELQATLKLILEGEPPYDLFVRWKPLSQQAIGWQPDLNDGVRMNIRPFATADILRKRVKIKWDKDRGKEPQRDKAEYPRFWGWDEEKQDFAGVGSEPDGNRWNDCHYAGEFKQRARK